MGEQLHIPMPLSIPVSILIPGYLQIKHNENTCSKLSKFAGILLDADKCCADAP